MLALVGATGCIDFDQIESEVCRDRPHLCNPVDAGTPSCTNIVGDRRTQVCLRWTCDRADLSEGFWSGSLATCTAGDSSGRVTALKWINTHRFLADLPEVITAVNRDAAAQDCALMADATNMLGTMPASTSACFTTEGGNAARNSLQSLNPAVKAIEGLFHATTATQTTRRYLLSGSLGPLGIGTTSGASCFWVAGGTGTATRRFTAWPPPGPVPLDALSTGPWTVHTDAAADDLTGASVTVTDQGVLQAVTVTELPANNGSRSALRFVPMGWVAQAGHSYQVEITSGSLLTPISYTVEVVTCR